MRFENKLVALIPWINNLARRYYKDEMNSEDLASETILKILLNKDRYNNNKDLKPWCVAIMQNTFLTWSARTSLVQFVAIENIDVGSMASYIEFNDIISILKGHINSLNVMCVYLYAAGYSYEEIADKLNIKIGTVRSRIFNGRKILRYELDKRQ